MSLVPLRSSGVPGVSEILAILRASRLARVSDARWAHGPARPRARPQAEPPSPCAPAPPRARARARARPPPSSNPYWSERGMQTPSNPFRRELRAWLYLPFCAASRSLTGALSMCVYRACPLAARAAIVVAPLSGCLERELRSAIPGAQATSENKSETVPKRRVTGKHNPLKPRRKGEDVD